MRCQRGLPPSWSASCVVGEFMSQLIKAENAEWVAASASLAEVNRMLGLSDRTVDSN